MKKRFTKIICVIVGAVAALGVTLTAGCSDYTSKPLAGDYSGAVTSNGGFAVEKGNYVYFVNGIETNTAENSFGTPVKGAVYRIAKSDLNAHNYKNAERVVKNVAYTADYDAGLFIYGDYIYYATPSTDKSATGQVQNEKLDMKRTKLDGSTTSRTAFAQLPSTSTEYRFVQPEENGAVYLMYVATGEKLYDETDGVNNLHSVKIEENGKTTDTLLAYNVDKVVFDESDKTNPRVYYTMNVRDYSRDTNYSYNQVYTVKADATEDKFADKTEELEKLEGWNTDESKGDLDRYINCGDLVFDGIGRVNVVTDGAATPFNADPTGENVNDFNLTYALSSYQNGMLFYTRTTQFTDNTTTSLYNVKESVIAATGWNAVTSNVETTDYFVLDSADVDKYTYVFNAENDLEKVIIAESDGGIYVNVIDGNGKLQDGDAKDSADYYSIVRSGDCTVLFVDGNYLYYSVAGSETGYTFNRVDYTGAAKEYNVMPEEDEYDDFRPVQILNLLSVSDWFKPELLDNQLLFASNTDGEFSAVNYIMAFDLKARGGEGLMDNAAVNTLNKQFEEINKTIDNFGDTDKYAASTYANITSVLKYAYYTGESADVYLKGLAEACNAEARKDDEDADLVYSEETLGKYADFLNPESDTATEWADFKAKIKVNGEDVYANRRDYYYSVVGKMSETDANAYADALKSNNLKPMPEEEGWYDGLSTVEKVFFIIGMCLIGLGVIAAIVVPTTLALVRKRRGNAPVQRKKKIKVDTTDDRNIDVYSDSDGQTPTEE